MATTKRDQDGSDRHAGQRFPRESLARSRVGSRLHRSYSVHRPRPYYLGSQAQLRSSLRPRPDPPAKPYPGISRFSSAPQAHRANPHVDYPVGIVRGLAAAGLHFKLAVVRSEVDKGWLKAKLQAGKVKP